MNKRILLRKLFRLARDERGVELVEFAMTALVLVVLLFGVFEFGFALYAYHFTSYAAQEGARFAMVRGYTWSKNTTSDCATSPPPNFTMPYSCTASITDIENYVRSLATGGISASSVTINTTSSYVWPGKTPDGVTTTCTQTNSQGCLVKVTVNYSFSALPFLKISAIPISATSENVILQ
ncbi:MAG: TadE family protein [Terracidiphilus sp.]